MFPFSRQDRDSLRSYLLECLTPEAGRWSGDVCNHSLRYTTSWLRMCGYDVATYTTWFQQAEMACDCRVLITLVRALGAPALTMLVVATASIQV